MQMTNVSEMINCDHNTYLALRDALSARPEDFGKSGIKSSYFFSEIFPMTRAREPFSGLWDYFDKEGLGQAWGSAYISPGVDVVWHDHRAWIRAINKDVSLIPLTKIIQRVCSKYLPLTLTWTGVAHDFAPGSVVGGCAKITQTGVEHMTTAFQLDEWWTKLPQPEWAPRPAVDEEVTDYLIRRIRANAIRQPPAKCKSGSLVIYIPEGLSQTQRRKRYEQPLHLVFKAQPHSCVAGGTSWLAMAGGADDDLIACEIVISSGDVPETRELLRSKLPGGQIPAGTQVQYKTVDGLLYDEWDGHHWSVSEERCKRRVQGKCIAASENAR